MLTNKSRTKSKSYWRFKRIAEESLGSAQSTNKVLNWNGSQSYLGKAKINIKLTGTTSIPLIDRQKITGGFEGQGRQS